MTDDTTPETTDDTQPETTDEPTNNADFAPGEAPAAVETEEAPAYVEIPDRSTPNAKRALEAARNVGVDVAEVRTTSKGFIVPAAVGDEYDRLLAAESDDGTAVTDPTPDPTTPPPADPATGETSGPAEPKRNGSKADWEAYAATQGYNVDEGLSRDELADRYATPAE